MPQNPQGQAEPLAYAVSDVVLSHVGIADPHDAIAELLRERIVEAVRAHQPTRSFAPHDWCRGCPTGPEGEFVKWSPEHVADVILR